jgi:gas vesicle protein
MSKNRAINLAVGILIGSLAGVAGALLAAPQSGEKTRALIREKSGELRTKTTNTLTESRDKAKVVLTDARSKAVNLTDRLLSRVKELPAEVQDITA